MDTLTFFSNNLTYIYPSRGFFLLQLNTVQCKESEIFIIIERYDNNRKLKRLQEGHGHF